MGGCCCCSSRGAALNTAPAYYYYPRASDQRVPLSATCGGAAVSAFSTGLLVDTNLDTSVPDSYRPPPVPMPFDVAIGRPETLQRGPEVCSAKSGGTANVMDSDSGQGTDGGGGADSHEDSGKCGDVKGSDCKGELESELGLEKQMDMELSKPVESLLPSMEEEDSCPICLEEYDAENPKLITKCEHHFHLACILEWMERSESCPVCDKEMIFDTPID